MKGIVTWFNDSKGYGFIADVPTNPTGDHAKDYPSKYFAHYTTILGEGFKTLAEGQKVEFDVYEGPKGLHAINIKRNI
jgi:CspA family cold shock protein